MMKLLALNGSHRPGKNTANILDIVLEAARDGGCDTELIELSTLNIQRCSSCNACLRAPQCSITDDDMTALGEKLLACDGLLIGSPVYWSNVSTVMKNFMDRSRYLHMTANLLHGKVGGAVTGAGLLTGGQEPALQIMNNFLLQQGLLVTDCRDASSMVIATGVAGSLTAGIQDDKVQYRRRMTEDALLQQSAAQLGRNMLALMRTREGSK